jgi:hypothetical protein
MTELAQKHKDQLESIKTDIENSYNYFRSNYTRFNAFREYIFKQQIDAGFAGILNELNMPQHEFNVLFP